MVTESVPDDSSSLSGGAIEDADNKNVVDEDEVELSAQCGEQTAENHPWIAILEHTDPYNPATKKKTLSKGVLISRQHVLTTVSSIHNSHPFWVVSGIRLGDTPTWATNQMLRTGDQIQRFDVSEVYIHEYKDIAVIKLDRKANITGKYVLWDNICGFNEIFHRGRASNLSTAKLSPHGIP